VRETPGLLDERASDGDHFTAKGHAIIASYRLPQVTELVRGVIGREVRRRGRSTDPGEYGKRITA
jgi:hypothetical protein